MKKSEIFQIILEVVCRCTEVSPDLVMSGSRQEEAVLARCLVAAYGMENGLTNKCLQEFLNLKSHSSVCYAQSKYTERMRTDRRFRSIANYVGREMVAALSASGQ